MSKTTMPLTEAAVSAHAERYLNNLTAEQCKAESAISAAIQTVRANGYVTREQFIDVCRWKTPRIGPQVALNQTEHIEEATRVALSSTSEELRTGALMALRGVGLSVASVFLHWFHRDPYPILDFRAVEALGFNGPILETHEHWMEFVHFWRNSGCGFDARTFDRALWQWSKEH